MHYKKIISFIAVLFLLLFAVFVFLYEGYAQKKALAIVEKHARIMSNALWNYDTQAASKYLSLACSSDNYRQIAIKDSKGKIFYKAYLKKHTWEDQIFASLKLIKQITLRSDIIHKGKIIGQLEVVWNCDTVYFELLILFVMVMLYIILILIIRLLYLNQFLETRIIERTRELSNVNSQLLKEIQEHKNARKELSRTQKLYDLIAENAADVIWVADMDMNITYISPSCFPLGGFTPREMMEKSLDKTLLPDSLEKAVKIYENKLNLIQKNDPRGWETERFEVQEYCKDGSVLHTEINARFLPDENNRPYRVLGITRDITKQHKAQADLKESEEKYRNILTNMDDGYFEVDLAGNFTFFNDSVARILGYSTDELMGMNNQEYMDKENAKKIFNTFNKVYRTGIPTKALDWKLIKKDGSQCFIETVVSLIKDSDKNITGFRGIARDVGDRIKAQNDKLEALQFASEQEKQALVGKIAGKMAHDFNNVLGIIMGNAQLALLDCKDEKIKQTLDLIFEQTNRGKNLTRNLVAFAKDQEPKQEFFQISEKLDLVVSLLKKDMEGIHIIKDTSQQVPDLLADPGMIEHAMVNLFQNSIHALSLTEKPKISVRTFLDQEKICFEIKDNGCGIPKEHLDSIFDPAFTLKGSSDTEGAYQSSVKGTGYGMSNIKKYVDQHKGSIFIESEPGSGTKVILSFPFVRKELTSREKDIIQKTEIKPGKYILIVEDENDIADVQYKILSKEPCSHNVDIAHNGQAAMDMFDRNQYDLISLDYILPGGINGMDIYNHIRKTDTAIPVLFISGNIEFLKSIKQLKQKDPNVDHISKPCQNRDYINRIHELIK